MVHQSVTVTKFNCPWASTPRILWRHVAFWRRWGREYIPALHRRSHSFSLPSSVNEEKKEELHWHHPPIFHCRVGRYFSISLLSCLSLSLSLKLPISDRCSVSLIPPATVFRYEEDSCLGADLLFLGFLIPMQVVIFRDNLFLFVVDRLDLFSMPCKLSHQISLLLL